LDFEGEDFGAMDILGSGCFGHDDGVPYGAVEPLEERFLRSGIPLLEGCKCFVVQS